MLDDVPPNCNSVLQSSRKKTTPLGFNVDLRIVANSIRKGASKLLDVLVC
jgi:hypothetical protein